MRVPLARWLFRVLILNLIVLGSSLPISLAQTETSFKVGAWGDDASRNNLGVRVRIQTHSYAVPQSAFDYFWVGDDLSDGAFIQFGYSLEPGVHCIRGQVSGGTLECVRSELIGNSDARWEWQYWPDRLKVNFLFGVGGSESAGHNATSHEYTIMATPLNTWSFLFDNETVAQTTFPSNPSIDPALIVAEGSVGNSTRQLGPTRFDALSYYDGLGWKLVDSLVSASYCGISIGCVANQYGAVAVGPDSIIAGSGVLRLADGTLLWTSQEERMDIRVHPGVQFFVTSVFGTEQFTEKADVGLPKGMFAYVSLPDTDSATPGVLGWLGAQDHFHGWQGSVVSRNLTVRILVDSNQQITAIWTTDTTVPLIILLASSLFACGLASILTVKKLRARAVVV